jgi:hypothetical protein
MSDQHDTLAEYLVAHKGGGSASPSILHNPDGRSVEAYWGEDRAYAQDTAHKNLVLLRSMKDDAVVGVKLHGFRPDRKAGYAACLYEVVGGTTRLVSQWGDTESALLEARSLYEQDQQRCRWVIEQRVGDSLFSTYLTFDKTRAA